MKSLVIFALTLCALVAQAQPDTLWTRCIGGPNQEYPFSICRTSDGGYVVAGTGWTVSDTSFAWLAKVDDGGGLLWYRTYRVTLGPSIPLFQSPDCGFVIISSLRESEYPPERSVILLLKVNAVGDSVWSRVFEEPHNIGYLAADTTADGGFIVAATLDNTTHDRANTWLLKLNATGDSLWSRLFASAGMDLLGSVSQARDGGYAVAGDTYTFGDSASIIPWLLKTDGTGHELWRHNFVYPNTWTTFVWMQQTRDGGYVLAGNFSHLGERGQSWLLKTDENGDSVWSRTYGGDFPGNPNFVLETSDGGYLATGVSSTNTSDILWVMKANARGDSLWSQTWPDIETFSQYYGRYAVQTSDHGYAVIGQAKYGLLPHCPREYWPDAVLIRMAPDTGLAVREHEITALDFSLQQNYPNPFNSLTTIVYNLPKPADIRLCVFDLLGREVVVLVDGLIEAGQHKTMLNSAKLASGVYFYRLETGPRMVTRKMLLLK